MGVPHILPQVRLRGRGPLGLRLRQGQAALREGGLLPLRAQRQVPGGDGHEALAVLRRRAGADRDQRADQDMRFRGAAPADQQEEVVMRGGAVRVERLRLK